MKKVLLTLGLTLMMLVGFSQTPYRVKTTEMYTYNSNTSEWELYQKNGDVNIVMTLEEKGVITIQAKTPSMYRFDKESGVDISGKTFTGYRYDGVDLRENESCKIDIIKINTGTYVVSIIKSGKYNLRYYILPE